jgi:hypothetical protein
MIKRAGDGFRPAQEPFEAEKLDRPDANSREDRPQPYLIRASLDVLI